MAGFQAIAGRSRDNVRSTCARAFCPQPKAEHNMGADLFERVCFGRTAAQQSHTFRHCDAAGLDRATVRSAIVADMVCRQRCLGTGLNRGRVRAGGLFLDYAAYKFLDGSINVGRITTIGKDASDG